MSISEALSARGIEFNMIGPEPETEAEYVERIDLISGSLPDWPTIQQEAAKLTFHTVSKLTIITRLEEQNKFDEALVALKQDDLLYEKWSAVSELRSNDVNARALFAAIGCDPDAILAPEDAV